MLVTPSPLTERMTLFWHNHFVSSQQKVRFARLMYQQNALLRATRARQLRRVCCTPASKDPAMLIYLDTAQSRKGQPNENFAREVMELFTLGEGHYTEARRQGSRARVHRLERRPRHGATSCSARALHDDGVKTVLGQSGRFDGDAVLDLLLARPQTAEFVAAKLWREFVSAEPDARRCSASRGASATRNYEIKVALRELLLSPMRSGRPRTAAR